MEDAGRGWRQVVPSPLPNQIIEIEAIQNLVKDGFIVIAVGGGGIPIVEKPGGDLHGIEAVIDKDFTSGLLAKLIHADLFIIITAVEKVALNYNKPDQQWLNQMTLAEAERYIGEGHFSPGSMLPKIQAIVKFLKEGGKQAFVTDPPNIKRALMGGEHSNNVERESLV